MAQKEVKKAVRKPVKTQAKRTKRPAPRQAKKARAAATPQAKKSKKPAAKARKLAKPARRLPTRARKAPSRKPVKVAVRKAPARKAAPVRKAPPVKTTALPTVAPVRKSTTKPPARLQRERRRLPEADADGEAFLEVSEDSRLMSSARAGHDELRSEMKRHTESSPALTAGDVDAKWQDAYALGDEAPGGDNMTPDQDRVDDIGKALGIEYADDEELMGGDELTERDEHRWELDPASKEDDEEL